MTDEATANNVDQAAPERAEDAGTLRARVAELEAALEHERDQATDYMKRWQYAQAELANLRRRHQQERDELSKFGIAPLAAVLLEVLDNFERAEQAIPSALRSYTWISGVLLIHRQLEYVLQQQGLAAITAEGQRYDPSVHEALTEEHHGSVAEGSVIAEVQRGYQLHGRLLRPALVRVSRGPTPAGEQPGQPASDSGEGAAEADTGAKDG